MMTRQSLDNSSILCYAQNKSSSLVVRKERIFTDEYHARTRKVPDSDH